MQWDADNINMLHARSVQKTRTETTQQIAVPHGILWISVKRQPPSDIYIYIYIYVYSICLLHIYLNVQMMIEQILNGV